MTTPPPAPPEDSRPQTQRISRIQVMEATAAAVLAAAIISTAGGMSWLVIQLPNRLQQLEGQITRILNNQERFEGRFANLEEKVQEHDRRIIKLEMR